MEENINQKAMKAGSWYVISNFLLKGIAVITTPVFSRLLTPDAFGITNTYTSWLGILTVIGTLDIYSCIQISRYDFNDKEIDSFISSILSLSSAFLIILYMAVKLFGSKAVSLFEIPPKLIDILFLEVLFTNAFTILQTKHRAFFKYKEFVFLSCIVAVLSPVLSIVLISLQNNELYYWKIVGNAAPKIFISAFIFIYIFVNGKCIYKKEYWKYALAISVPLIPHHLAGNILNNFDKIMITKYAGSADTGLYSLAYSYSYSLGVIWSSFNHAWVPWFYGKMNKDKLEDIKKYVKPYIVIFTLIYMIMLLAGPEMLRIFGPSEYWGGRWVIPPVLLGFYFQFIYSLYVNIEFYFKKTKLIAIGTILAAAINIVLNLIYIPIYGYIIAAYTTLVGYGIMFILHYFIANKLETRNIYNNKFIILDIICIVLLTTLVIFIYDSIFLRYSLLIFILLAIFLYYRRHLVLFYKNMVRRKRNEEVDW